MVPFTGICGWRRYDPGIGISCPGIKTQGVVKTQSACLLGALGSAFRLFWENTKEKMASIRT